MSTPVHEHGYITQAARRACAGVLKSCLAALKGRQKATLVVVLFFVSALLLGSVVAVRARPLLAVAPGLGTAASFAVLAGSTVVNTGPTVVTGDLGVSPGSAVTGFPPGVVVPPSVIHAADAVALQAQSDVNTAYTALAGQACDVVLTGQDLGGLTLTPAVYCFSSSAFLTGILTLDAQGDPNAVFVFQIGSTLITAPNSSVGVVNGTNACNVFWQVGSSATLGTATAFIGNILALTSITLNTGASNSGRILAQNGAVTMDTNTIPAGCAVAAPTPTPTATNTPVPTATNTPVPTATNTPVPTATNTPVPTATNTPVLTATNTPVLTAINTPVPTAINTPVPTAINTPVPTGVATGTPVATVTNTPIVTATQLPTGLYPVDEPLVLQASKLYLPLVTQ